jgi:hypothetical protein
VYYGSARSSWQSSEWKYVKAHTCCAIAECKALDALASTLQYAMVIEHFSHSAYVSYCFVSSTFTHRLLSIVLRISSSVYRRLFYIPRSYRLVFIRITRAHRTHSQQTQTGHRMRQTDKRAGGKVLGGSLPTDVLLRKEVSCLTLTTYPECESRVMRKGTTGTYCYIVIDYTSPWPTFHRYPPILERPINSTISPTLTSMPSFAFAS